MVLPLVNIDHFPSLPKAENAKEVLAVSDNEYKVNPSLFSRLLTKKFVHKKCFFISKGL